MTTTLQATTTYDLLTERWVPIVTVDGVRDHVGILDTLAQAHRIREVLDPSPLVTISIMRLLIAIVHQALSLQDDGAWEDAWHAGAFDAAMLARVQEACAGRFDLFHPTRPFYQSADIAPMVTRDAKSIGTLVLDAATGTATRHYAHTGEDAHQFCPACSAKALVMLPAFATSGGQGIKPSINGVPPIYVMPLGETLFHTLLLNHLLPMYRAERMMASPAWSEETGIVGYKEERATVGFLESFTWQARRIRLFPQDGEDGCTRCGERSTVLVCECIYMQGRSLVEGALPWRDPWAAYTLRIDAKSGEVNTIPVRLREERATWRDTGALFLANVDERSSLSKDHPITVHPHILDQVFDVVIRDRIIPPETPIRFMTVGLRTDMKAKVFEYRADYFDFPAAILGREAALPVKDALTHAESVARYLGDALCRLHPEADREKPKWGDIKQAMAQVIALAQRQYWQRLDATFRQALFDDHLQGGIEQQQAWLAFWYDTVRHIASTVLEGVLDNYDTDAAALARQHAARRKFYYELKKHQREEA